MKNHLQQLTDDEECVIIESNQKFLSSLLREAISKKALLLSFIRRDVKAKYANTFLGVVWLFLDPVLNITILYFVFYTLAKAEGSIESPIIFILIGMCIWTLYSTSLAQSGQSFQSYRDLIKKIYFPRIFIPLTKSVFAIIPSLVLFFVIILYMAYYESIPIVNVLYSLFFLLIALLGSFGLGLIVNALQLKFYDFHYVLPFLIRIGLFLSPIAYDASRIPPNFQTLYYLNPAAGSIQGFRLALNGATGDLIIYLSVISNFIWLILGLYFFKSIENKVAEQL